MAFFVPKDIRYQQMFIKAKHVPEGFFERSQDFENFLFVAELPEYWSETNQYGIGRLIKNLGHMENVEAQTEAILLMNKIDVREYTEKSINSIKSFMGKKSRKKLFTEVNFILNSIDCLGIKISSRFTLGSDFYY